MSVLNYTSRIAGHQVQTSVAHLLARKFRFCKWAMELLMGNGNVPCEPFSCPEADGRLDLAYEFTSGLITIDSYDLNCVAESQVAPTFGRKVITINCPSQVTDEVKVIYLCNTTPPIDDDSGLAIPSAPVYVYLTNNGIPVPGPEYYLVAPGDLRYLIIRFGRIVSIEN
jgi:hypothetical protein